MKSLRFLFSTSVCRKNHFWASIDLPTIREAKVDHDRAPDVEDLVRFTVGGFTWPMMCVTLPIKHNVQLMITC